jgi:hypothetical protein
VESSLKATPRWLIVILLVLVVVILASLIWDISANTAFGENDFVGYWAATYLFHNGQNPYDPELMGITQQTQLETSQNVTIMSWNPPTLFVFLLPLAWLSFIQAKFTWLIVNLVIVTVVSLMLVGVYHPTQSIRYKFVSVLFALLFPPVISGLYMGQIAFLVLLGLTASIYFIKKGDWFWAGAALILTTIKPHLVILAVIYLIIHMAQERQFKGWAGLLTAGLACLGLLFLFRPAWINDLVGLSSIAPVNWATPTIGGMLSSMRITESARYLIFLALPLPFVLAWQRQKFPMEFSVALLTLITIPVTFFGWNYDQCMLLIPIALIFSWLAEINKRPFKVIIISLIILSVAINFYLRSQSVNDVFYVWFPLFWWFVFFLTWYYHSIQSKAYE